MLALYRRKRAIYRRNSYEIRIKIMKIWNYEDASVIRWLSQRNETMIEINNIKKKIKVF